MGDAVRVTASEFARNFVRYQDHAIAGDIVQVTSEGRVIGGFISAQELERFERLKAREPSGLAPGRPDGRNGG